MLRSKKGQSLLEYILILTVIVTAIVAARAIIQQRAQDLINVTAAGAINQSADAFNRSLDNISQPNGTTLPVVAVPQIQNQEPLGE